MSRSPDRCARGRRGCRQPGDHQGSLSAGSNYALAFTGSQLTITPAPLTVKANDATAIANGPFPAFTATITGFVFGETAAVLGGTLQFAVAPPDTTPGTHTITPSGLTSTNYAIAFVPGR